MISAIELTVHQIIIIKAEIIALVAGVMGFLPLDLGWFYPF